MSKLLFLFLFLFNASCAAKTIKVMVIDTGVDLSHKEIKSHVKEDWNLDYIDDHGHGTEIASVVLKDTCGDIELISCKYYYPWKKIQIDDSNACFQRALDENVNYVNYSSSGEQPDDDEKELIRQLSKKGTIVVVAAGNKEKDLTKTGKCLGSFPACYSFKNLYTVQNIDENEKITQKSNHLIDKNARSVMGVNIPVLQRNGETGYGTGSSYSAAKYTNSMLLKRCWELKK